MKGRYRSRVQIVRDMLNALMTGEKSQTHIMYEAFLSWVQLKEYLSMLIRNELVTTKKEGSHLNCRITAKGREFLELCKSADAFIEPR
jgi:predicted transcriptional regulator